MVASTAREDQGHASMYAALLTAARARYTRRPRDADRGPQGQAALGAQLARLRALRGARGPVRIAPRGDLVGDIAVQLAYDLVLLDLCDIAGVDVDMRHFDQPLRERRHLEAALRGAGVDVGSGPDGGPRRPSR